MQHCVTFFGKWIFNSNFPFEIFLLRFLLPMTRWTTVALPITKKYESIVTKDYWKPLFPPQQKKIHVSFRSKNPKILFDDKKML